MFRASIGKARITRAQYSSSKTWGRPCSLSVDAKKKFILTYAIMIPFLQLCSIFLILVRFYNQVYYESYKSFSSTEEFILFFIIFFDT